MAKKRKLLSVEEACVLARRTIYHTTFRDGASVYNVGPNGWKNCQETILTSLENKLDSMEIVLMCKLRPKCSSYNP
ncbi:hypothetical protein YC2023_010451 [Brassica napus]